MSEWRITKKEIKGLLVSAIIIENDSGESKRISLEDAITLARNEKIENAVAILDTSSGKYILDVNNGLTSLDTIYHNNGLNLTIICRLIDSNKKCIGYKVKDETGKTYKISLSKAWELALNNSIYGVKARINGKTKCIISTEDFKLSNIPDLMI